MPHWALLIPRRAQGVHDQQADPVRVRGGLAGNGPVRGIPVTGSEHLAGTPAASARAADVPPASGTGVRASAPGLCDAVSRAPARPLPSGSDDKNPGQR